MKRPIESERALEEAEMTCHKKVTELLGLTSGVDSFIATNGGRTDCAVFDIGSPWTGEVAGFGAEVQHWRATLDFYSRDRKQVQRWIMRLMLGMPIQPEQGVANDLTKVSTVEVFRFTPETNYVSEISTTELVFRTKDAKGQDAEKKVEVWTAKATFDVVFRIGRGIDPAPEI